MTRPLFIGTLADGIPVVGERLSGRRVQCYEVRVGTGYGGDPHRIPGVAHLVEHLVLRRAQGSPLNASTKTLEMLGARPTATTAREFTSFALAVPEDHAQLALTELHRMVIRPDLSTTAIDAELRIIAAERALHRTDPQRVLSEVAEGHLFGDPLVRSGPRPTLTAAREFWTQHYRPENIAIYTSGPADDRSLGLTTSCPRPTARPDAKSEVTALPPQGIRALHIRWSNMEHRRTHLLSCFCVANQGSESRAAANVLVALLGGGFSALLVRKLRTERQLSYSPRVFYTDLGATGLISAFATVAASDDQAAGEIMECAPQNLASDPLLAERVDLAKAHLRMGTLIAYDDLPRRVSALASSWERRQQFVPSGVLKAIDRVSPEAIAELVGTLSSLAPQHIVYEEESAGPTWR